MATGGAGFNSLFFVQELGEKSSLAFCRWANLQHAAGADIRLSWLCYTRQAKKTLSFGLSEDNIFA
jgi:hypothetical protein